MLSNRNIIGKASKARTGSTTRTKNTASDAPAFDEIPRVPIENMTTTRSGGIDNTEETKITGPGSMINLECAEIENDEINDNRDSHQIRENLLSVPRNYCQASLGTGTVSRERGGNLGWNGWNRPVLTLEDVYQHREVFHAKFPKTFLTKVLGLLQRLFRHLSFRVGYNDSPITARCQTMEMTEFDVTINEARDEHTGTLPFLPSVLLQIHLCGGGGSSGAVSAARYARYILDVVSSSSFPAAASEASSMAASLLSTELQNLTVHPRRRTASDVMGGGDFGPFIGQGFNTMALPPPPFTSSLSWSSRAEMEQVEALVRNTHLKNAGRWSQQEDEENQEDRGPGRIVPKTKQGDRCYDEELNDSVVDALRIAYEMMTRVNLHDQRRLGLESMFHMTDPTKSGLSTAEAISNAVLFGQAPVGSGKGNGNNVEAECNYIRNMILVLALKGRWQGEDEAREERARELRLRMMLLDTMDTSEVEVPEHTDHYDRYLAMMCVVNGLKLLNISNRSQQERTDAALSILADARETTGLDLIETMMGIIRSSGSASCHLVYRATKILVCLFSFVPASVRCDMMIVASSTNNENFSRNDLISSSNGNNGNRRKRRNRTTSVLEEARRVVRSYSETNKVQHAALEHVTGKLLIQLSGI